MTSTTERRPLLVSALPWVGVAVVLGGGVLVALRFGAPALVLWIAFALLAGALLLFQEALRSVLDPDERTGQGEGVVAAARDVLAGLETRKRNALRALKDIEFEHAIKRLSDEDFAMLRERYRSEARAAMEAMDDTLGGYLTKAESAIDLAEGGAEIDAITAAADAESSGNAPTNRKRRKGQAAAVAAKPEPTAPVAVVEKPVEADATAAPARRECATCATSNEPDAVFCKKCGAKVGDG